MLLKLDSLPGKEVATFENSRDFRELIGAMDLDRSESGGVPTVVTARPTGRNQKKISTQSSPRPHRDHREEAAGSRSVAVFSCFFVFSVTSVNLCELCVEVFSSPAAKNLKWAAREHQRTVSTGQGAFRTTA
jgi:hypothetical protein